MKIYHTLFFLLITSNFLFGQKAEKSYLKLNEEFLEFNEVRSNTDSLISVSERTEQMGKKIIISTIREGTIHGSDSLIFDPDNSIGKFRVQTHHFNKNGRNVKLEYDEIQKTSDNEVRIVELNIYYKRNKPLFADYYELVSIDNKDNKTSKYTFLIPNIIKQNNFDKYYDEILKTVFKLIEENE